MGERSEENFESLIPSLSKWNNGSGIDVGTRINAVGNFELAIGYSCLFWPDFTEFEGCVVFADFSETSYSGFMEQCNRDGRHVEAVMNHRHIYDYFSSMGSPTVDQLIYLGRRLKAIFEEKLSHDFPDRRSVVSFAEGPFDDLTDYEISFWQDFAKMDSDD